MASYSGEALRKLNMDDLIGIALSIQSKMGPFSAKVLEELKHLHEKF